MSEPEAPGSSEPEPASEPDPDPDPDPDASGPTAPQQVPDLPPRYGAGSRLAPIVLRHENVEQHTGTFWDEQAQAPCALSESGRCEFGFPASIVFLDDRCSSPLLRVQYADCYEQLPAWKRPRAATRTPSPDSCEELELYRAAGGRIAPPQVVYEGNADACTQRVPNPSDAFYEVERVPAGVATMTPTVEERDAPLHALVQSGDDGSWWVERFYDPARDWPCRPLSSGYTSADTCVPRMSQSGWFLDDACEAPLAISAEGPCDGDPLVYPELSPLEGVCEPRSLELFELGARVDATPRFGTGSTCTELTTITPGGFEVGAPIDVGTLPVVESLLGGEGRLRVPLVGSGGVPYFRDPNASTFFDASEGQGCREMIFTDGTIYCVPESFDQQTDTQVFADPSCSGDRLFTRSNVACREFEGVVMNQYGCGAIQSEVFSVVPFEGETGYELKPDGSCTSFTVTIKTPYYVSTGRLEPSERFARLEAVIAR